MKIKTDELNHSLELAGCYESTSGTQGEELVRVVIEEINTILKHRNCRKCKFWINQGEMSRCRKDVITLSNQYFTDHNSFYCKKWEQKENQ